ncbi:MAG: EthD family reductase [Chloroflexi bacterium]|nr:MAG: EthD family reductase [Chloroflexota bacterium]MBL1192872.1 EthD family reductase [Chloroflexota bacterium]NOH10165.1 EthD family reductase [Chloroflexota bacterium]
MYKLIIIIEPQDDWVAFEKGWPDFLAAAEKMPGLRREVTSRVDKLLHGTYHAALMHELFFDDMEAARQAMASDEGQATGQVLQTISGGKLTLLFADHLEDELENIKQFTAAEDDSA